MKALRGIAIALSIAVAANAQSPTSYEYHNLSPSADGTVLYGSSSIEGTMSGSFPHGVIRHTYTASFRLIAPTGSGIADVPCSVSQSGDPNASYDPACYSSISFIGIGTYQQVLSDSAVCSYAGEFFSNAGTNVQFQGAYPNLNGIVTLTANPDGSFTASMSKNDYINFSAFAQEYFQSECGCPDYGGVIDDINTAVINTTVTITLVTKIAMNNMLTWMNKTSPEARNTPIKDQPPNSVKVFDKTRENSTGSTVRVYGPDGRAVRDIDYGNQAHTTDPEVHEWTWDSNGNGKRADPGRAPKPGEVPPGY